MHLEYKQNKGQQRNCVIFAASITDKSYKVYILYVTKSSNCSMCVNNIYG
jgi:hypothetical protein